MNPFKRWWNGESKELVKNEPMLTLNDVVRKSSVMSQSDAGKIEAFYSCIKDKSETISQLPLILYRYSNDGRRSRVTSDRLNRIFTKRPNDFQTIADFVQMAVVSIETIGAFYAYKVKNDRGNVMELIPFFNQRNVVPSHDVHGNIYYNYVYNDGRPGDPFNIDDLLIVKNFTFDGYTPVSPIVYLSTILGIASSQDENYKELQTNGITSQMALGTDGKFNDDKAVKRLKEQWDNYRGLKGRKSIPILEDGLKPLNLKLTPQETELLKNREFTVKRIASALGVPLYRINEYEGTMSKGVLPELDESYMRNKLNPVMRKIETALDECLPDGLKIEFNRKAFYAGSPWRLVEHVHTEVKGGLATINEGREDLGREPVDGGDVFAIDSNNSTYGKWPELPAVREQINGRATDNNGVTQTQEEEGNVN